MCCSLRMGRWTRPWCGSTRSPPTPKGAYLIRPCRPVSRAHARAPARARRRARSRSRRSPRVRRVRGPGPCAPPRAPPARRAPALGAAAAPPRPAPLAPRAPRPRARAPRSRHRRAPAPPPPRAPAPHPAVRHTHGITPEQGSRGGVMHPVVVRTPGRGCSRSDPCARCTLAPPVSDPRAPACPWCMGRPSGRGSRVRACATRMAEPSGTWSGVATCVWCMGAVGVRARPGCGHGRGAGTAGGHGRGAGTARGRAPCQMSSMSTLRRLPPRSGPGSTIRSSVAGARRQLGSWTDVGLVAPQPGAFRQG